MASWLWAIRTQANTPTNPWRYDNEPLEHKQTHRLTHGVVALNHQNTRKHTEQPKAPLQWTIRTQAITQTNPWRHDKEPSEHKQTNIPTHGVVKMSLQNTKKHTFRPMASWQWAIRTQTNTQTNKWRRDNDPTEHIQTHRPTHGVVTMSHLNTNKHTGQPISSWQWAITTQIKHRLNHCVLTMSHQNTSKHKNQSMTSWQWDNRTQTNTHINPMASWQWANRAQTHRRTHCVVTMSHQNTNKHTDQPMASWQWAIRTQTNTHTPTHGVVTMSQQNTN